MKPNIRSLLSKVGVLVCFSCLCCGQQAQTPTVNSYPQPPTNPYPLTNPYPFIKAIPLPAGYHRIPDSHDPFAAWLRSIPLKKDKTVYLFNGAQKLNQDAQFAVLDITVGMTDLQQCADAVMRLRAEYMYAKRDYINIDFSTDQGTRFNFLEWANGR